MTIKDSLQRLGWRFSEAQKKQKGFIPNKNDVDAINALIDFYEKTSKDNYNNNELMFKMYIWHRVELMKHYNSDILDMMPQRKLAETLCKPVDVFINRLTSYLNDQEYKVMTSDVPHSQTHPYLLNEFQRIESGKELERLLKEKPDLLKTITGEFWSKEDILDNIVSEFNQLLQIAS